MGKLGLLITQGFLIEYNPFEDDYLMESSSNCKGADQLIAIKLIKTTSLNVKLDQKWSIILENRLKRMKID